MRAINHLRMQVAMMKMKGIDSPLLISEATYHSLESDLTKGNPFGWKCFVDMPEKEKKYPGTIGSLDGVSIVVDERCPTLTPYGDCDSYTMMPCYSYENRRLPYGIYIGLYPWWKRLWKAVTGRSRQIINFPKKGL